MNKFEFVSILLLFTLSGCTRTPDHFPTVIPCTVTITDNGTPVKGVFVQISTVPPTDSLTVSAQTDAQGKAVMQSQLGTFAKPGVPVGKLVMVLTKIPDVPDFKSSEEIDKMTYEQSRAYRAEMKARRAKAKPIIPPTLTAVKTSPLTMDTVSKKSINWNVSLEEYLAK
jgi:hypothetical protein